MKGDWSPQRKEISHTLPELEHIQTLFRRRLDDRHSALRVLQLHAEKLRAEGIEDTSVFDSLASTEKESVDPWLMNFGTVDLTKRVSNQSRCAKEIKRTKQRSSETRHLAESTSRGF